VERGRPLPLCSDTSLPDFHQFPVHRPAKALEDQRTPRRFAMDKTAQQDFLRLGNCGDGQILLLPLTLRKHAMSFQHTSWPHAPTHELSQAGTYFITAATYRKQQHFRGPERLAVLQRGLLKLAADHGWQIEAWALFSNHYHFVGHSPGDATTLSPMLKILHTRTAGWINRLDQTPGRRVWHNFRETRLTFQRAYLARLNYVHQNAVRHGLVPVANQYPWCSAAWFERTASLAMVRALYRFKTDRIRVQDEFEMGEGW